MLPPFSFSASIAFLGACFNAEFATGYECRPQDSIVPRPNLARSESFWNATARLTDILDAAVNGSIKAGWDVPNTSFSVAVITQDQLSAAGPAWEYHHLGSNSSLGTRAIDRYSQYLIGSVSKVFTTAVLLRSGVDLDDSITKYLPALGSTPSLISWDNITLRALASHMSGIPPNCIYGQVLAERVLTLIKNVVGLSEFYYLKNYSAVLGFPELIDQDYLPCDVVGLNSGCTQNRTSSARYPLPPLSYLVAQLCSIIYTDFDIMGRIPSSFDKIIPCSSANGAADLFQHCLQSPNVCSRQCNWQKLH
jgi:Beta-lactamase